MIKATKDIKNNPTYNKIMKAIRSNKNDIWIVKPGENTNRGKGIFLSRDEHEI